MAIVRPARGGTNQIIITTTRVGGGEAITNNMWFLFSSRRDDEIARLEEQIRRLKEEQPLSPPQQQQETQTAAPDDDDVDEEETNKQRFNEVWKGKEMILSEQELINDGIVDEASSSLLWSRSRSTSGGLLGVVAAVVMFTALVSFSQIPVGQEGLIRYSATIGDAAGGASSSQRRIVIDLGDLNPDNPDNKRSFEKEE